MSYDIKKVPPIFFIIFLGTLDVICFNGIVRGLLIPYLIEMNIEDRTVYTIYCNSVTLVYMFPLLGAFISDYFFLGMNKTILLGSFLILLGMSLMLVNNKLYIYYSLLFLILGSGLIKAITPPLLGKICKIKNVNNDFYYFCQNISFNFGSICGLFLIGSIGEYFSWEIGFACSFLVSLFLFAFSLINNFLHTEQIPKQANVYKIFLLILFFFFLSYIYINFNYIADILTVTVILFIFFKIILLVKNKQSVSKKEAMYITYMMFISFMFVCLFEQSGSNLLLFCDRLTNKTILNYTLPISLFRAFDPFFTVLVGVIYITYYKIFLNSDNNYDNKLISYQYKFSIGFLLLTICFFSIYVACNMKNVTISAWLIINSYLLFALSEINIIPMGYAMIGSFDAKYNSTMLTALWSAALSLGSWGSGKIAIILTGQFLAEKQGYDINSYTKIFESLFIISNVIFMLILIIIYIIKFKRVKI